MFSSSYLLIFTSAPLHIFLSSHLLIFTSSHLHICSSSHLLIFTSSHTRTHIFTYSHLLSLSHSLSPLSSLLSLSPFSLSFLSLLSLSLFSLAFWIFLSLGRGWCRRGVTKREPFRTKWGSIVKNWGIKLRFYLCRTCPGATLSHEMRVDRQKLKKNCDFTCPGLVLEQPFRTKWRSIVKNWCKIAILLVPDLSWSNPFARNEGRRAKTDVKLRFYLCRTCPGATLSHEMRVDRQKLKKNCDFTCPGLVLEQPFRTKWRSIVKNWCKIAILLVPDLSWSNPFARNEGRCAKTEEKLRFYLSRSNPFARNEGRCAKTDVKLRFYLCRTCPGATLSHEMKADRQKLM